MYLLNYTPIQGLLMPAVCGACEQIPWLGYSVFWGVTLGGSAVLFYAFEQPVMALRDRWTVKDAVTAVTRNKA
jgi:hypothetical protein